MYYYKFHQYIARHDSSFAVLAYLLISNNVDCLHRTLTECHVIVVNVTRQIFSHPDEVEKKKRERERNQEKERISNEAKRERQEPLKGLYIVGSRWRSLFRLALDVDREKSRRQTHKGEGRRRRSRKRERGLVEGSRSKRGPAVTRLGMGPHGVLASISTSIASSSSSFSFVTSFSFYIASRPLSSLSFAFAFFLSLYVHKLRSTI